TGVVLTHNEEQNIQKCLDSLQFCDSIIVVDDDSTDDTVKLSQTSGAKVIPHSLNNDFSAQRNFALTQVQPGWVLFIDADEVVSKPLADEILTTLNSKFKIHDSYVISRLDSMWGRTLSHGNTAGQKFVRLTRHNAGSWIYPVHEIWQVKEPTGELRSPLLHYPHPSLYDFLSELNHYSTIRAHQFQKSGRKTNLFEIILGPVWRFVENYILKLGFLDGTAGFIHAMCMAFYMFLVSGKLWLLSPKSS
ncbi:MAG: glycosyltransferase family 2 protein, partial [Patescibacteria group bacterium]